MEELQNVGNQGSVLLKAVLLGVVVYGILLLILDSVFLLTPLSEGYMGWAAAGALCLGNFFSGIKAGSGFGKRGLLWGLLTSCLLTSLLIVFMKLTGGIMEFSDLSAVKCGICIFFGGLGGMIGVNRK